MKWIEHSAEVNGEALKVLGAAMDNPMRKEDSLGVLTIVSIQVIFFLYRKSSDYERQSKKQE